MNDHSADLRITGLAVRFRDIGDRQMRDLPFYNTNLEVEAFGFSPFGDRQLIGVLITPWFMNLIVLPLAAEPVVANRYGQGQMITLPGGERGFLYGGDEVIGAFWAHSLHSPMQKFASQTHARSEARIRLAEAMQRAQAEPAVPNPGRRAFLGGGRSSAAPR
jgi:[NiFe] hydrogenase assembly HybE family chaperone